jgi:hypothetical protein
MPASKHADVQTDKRDGRKFITMRVSGNGGFGRVPGVRFWKHVASTRSQTGAALTGEE